MPRFKVGDTVVCSTRVGINIFQVMKIFYIEGVQRGPTYFDVTGIAYKESDLELYTP